MELFIVISHTDCLHKVNDSKMAEADLRNMVMNFRVSDLQVLLGFAGKNKTGKKQELQSRALDLVKLNYPHVITKIKELHNRRYHNQLLTRPANYDIPDRPLTDRPVSNYDSAMNNNYGLRCNPNVRPMALNHGSVPSYPGKPYLSPMPTTQPHYSQYADVKFRELPFYDILHMLLRPFSMIPDPVDRCQENTYNFSLSPQEAHDIAVSKDAAGNYECQILLRFCLLEVGTEQDDNFPPNISVKVNGKPVPLPNPIPTNRPGVEPKRPSRPVNVTPFSKLSPTVTNNITVTWSSSYGRSYAAVLYVARMVTSFTLLQRLKNRGLRGSEQTKAMIVDKLQQGQDSDIATTSLQASLMCPLGKLKMKLPCRALTCTHIACFDALLYIQLNEKKPKWRCPVCDKPALFKNLVLDGLFMDIVSKVPDECTDVELHDDGSWTPIMSVKENTVKKVVVEPKKNPSKPVEVVDIVDISSDSDTDEMWKSPSTTLTFSDVAKTPPVMHLCPDENLPQCNTPSFHSDSPVTTDYSSSTQMVEPVPVCLTSTMETDMQLSEHLNILPDIMPHPENSLPGNPSSGLGSSTYPTYPTSDSSAFYANNSNTFHDQPLPETNENSDLCYPNNFDIFDLLTMPQSEQLKYESMSKELPEKETNPTPPDVISLD